MFWNKKAIENPLGVPLSDLREILKHSGVDVLQEKDGSLVIAASASKKASNTPALLKRVDFHREVTRDFQ